MRGQRALSGPENLLEMLAGPIQSSDKAVEVIRQHLNPPPKNCEFLHVFLGGSGSSVFRGKKRENHTPLVAGACCCNFLVGNGQIHPQKLAPFHLSQPR